MILFLHGVPGSPESAFILKYNREIEHEYVMVYREQRGAGKSYPKGVLHLREFSTWSDYGGAGKIQLHSSGINRQILVGINYMQERKPLTLYCS